MKTTPHPDRVREFLGEPGNTVAELAREAGLHPNGLRKWRDEDWSPRWGTLVALCAAVDTINAKKEKTVEQQ